MSGATAKRQPSQDGLVLIEKYDKVFRYLYPQIQNFPRVHGKLRDAMLDTMLKIPSEMYLAVKLNQPSKLNTLDSSLAELRWFLRFSSSENVRLITKKQQTTAETLIAEVGGIDFLGYRIFEKYKLIRKDSVTRARRKIKCYTLNGDNESLKKFLASFYGHTKHSDSKNLWTNLFKYHEELKHVCKT